MKTEIFDYWKMQDIYIEEETSQKLQGSPWNDRMGDCNDCPDCNKD